MCIKYKYKQKVLTVQNVILNPTKRRPCVCVGIKKLKFEIIFIILSYFILRRQKI